MNFIESENSLHHVQISVNKFNELMCMRSLCVLRFDSVRLSRFVCVCVSNVYDIYTQQDVTVES